MRTHCPPYGRHRWPLRDASLGRLLRAVLFRFALVWVPIVTIGLWLALSQ